jgi:hypothetical protein
MWIVRVALDRPYTFIVGSEHGHDLAHAARARHFFPRYYVGLARSLSSATQ